MIIDINKSTIMIKYKSEIYHLNGEMVDGINCNFIIFRPSIYRIDENHKMIPVSDEVVNEIFDYTVAEMKKRGLKIKIEYD